MSETTRPAKRHRSPNYPAISLREAIEKVRIIYSEQRKTPGSREDFAKIMGYNGLTGSSVKVVSALSKYGLITGHGANIRVSEIGENLSLHQPGDVEYADAIRVAAESPVFFKELNANFPDGLPSEHTVRATLIKRGFSEKAVQPALDTFRDTQALLSEILDDQEWLEQAVVAPREALPSSDSTPLESSAEPVPAAQASQSKLHNSDYRIPISHDNEFILITGNFPIDEKQWNLFTTVLNSMKPALVLPEED